MRGLPEYRIFLLQVFPGEYQLPPRSSISFFLPGLWDVPVIDVFNEPDGWLELLGKLQRNLFIITGFFT